VSISVSKRDTVSELAAVLSSALVPHPVFWTELMYFNYMDGRNCNWNGGHDVVGTNTPDTVFGFAEGTCRPGFDTYFCVQNPGDAQADVDLNYMRGGGAGLVKQSIVVAAHSRSTIRANDALGIGNDASHDFSTLVSCTNNLKIIAERSIYFNYMGGYDYCWTGGSDVIGDDYAPKNFYFAEGTCRPGFDTYFCIMNDSHTAAANVTLTYMKGDGMTASDHVVVPPYSRSTVVPSDTLGTGNDVAHDFSTAISSDQCIIAERPMYFNYVGDQNCNWNGGHDVVGSEIKAQAFAFAEGTCRPGFETYFCIQNPNDTVATVALLYQEGTGHQVNQNITVPANSRYTVRASSILGVGNDTAHDFSTLVYCTNGQKIIAERPMYFNYSGGHNYNWTGGSDVVGAPGTVTVQNGQGLRGALFQVGPLAGTYRLQR